MPLHMQRATAPTPACCSGDRTGHPKTPQEVRPGTSCLADHSRPLGVNLRGPWVLLLRRSGKKTRLRIDCCQSLIAHCRHEQGGGGVWRARLSAESTCRCHACSSPWGKGFEHPIPAGPKKVQELLLSVLRIRPLAAPDNEQARKDPQKAKQDALQAKKAAFHRLAPHHLVCGAWAVLGLGLCCPWQRGTVAWGPVPLPPAPTPIHMHCTEWHA